MEIDNNNLAFILDLKQIIIKTPNRENKNKNMTSKTFII